MKALRLAAGALAAVMISACASSTPPPVVTPRYPDYVMPTLTSPDPAQAGVMRSHENGWRYFQAGDLVRAEREYREVLKKSPAFYPTEAALGYLELSRRNGSVALEHFDRALQVAPAYVPALLGRGETLLADSKEADALVAFESAVKADPSLSEIARRVEVLRARAAQENVAAARRAAQAGQLDEAVRAYEQAIAASPESAFLVRDLADVQVRQGKTDEALAHYREAIQLDSSDVQSRVKIAEILETRSDVEGAMTLYNEAYSLEPSQDLRRRIGALEARQAYMRLPGEYRAIPEEASITRADLASLIGIRLQGVLSSVVSQPVVITDTRGHWAERWIMAAAGAGVMEPFENHTFQPETPIQRSDLAQAVSRLLKIVAAPKPTLLKEWQSRQQKMADVGVSNLHFADASLSVASGVLQLAPGDQFELSKPVSGAEAIEAISRLERLSSTPQ